MKENIKNKTHNNLDDRKIELLNIAATLKLLALAHRNFFLYLEPKEMMIEEKGKIPNFLNSTKRYKKLIVVGSYSIF